MERVIDFSKDDYDALLIDRVRALDFVRTVLSVMDEGEMFTTFDDGTVLAALKAMYPEEYAAELRSRHAVKTPLYEIKTVSEEGGDDI